MKEHAKIINFYSLIPLVKELRIKRKKVVLCHGCFDWFHIGHLWHLKSAKRYGDILIVTVTPDVYVNKGPGRPIFNQQQRMEMLAAIEVVNYVALNLWQSAVETIKLLKPNYFVKGPDYLHRNKDMNCNIYMEIKSARKVGTNVVYSSDEKLSSTELLERWHKHFIKDDNTYDTAKQM